MFLVGLAMAAERVETPLGPLSVRDAYWACSAEHVIVGEIVEATPYAKAETAGGKFSQYATYTSFRVKVLRDLTENTPEFVDFHVRGEIVHPDRNTVDPGTVQPVVGLHYAIAFKPLQTATAMWPAGTPLIASSLYIDAVGRVPRQSVLERRRAEFCRGFLGR